MEAIKKTLVINLFGGPGSGKSTTCAGIFERLKLKGINCEMATEYAKDKVWEESYKTLDDQIYIFGKQLHRINRLLGKVDVIITDSPLINSIVYDKENNPTFKSLVLNQHNRLNNLNYYIVRDEHYEEKGRIQTKDEAEGLDNKIKKILLNNNINYIIVPKKTLMTDKGDYIYASDVISELVIQKLEEIKKSYEAVDLGLPSGTLWANKNIGAATEDDAGLYFQWGDTIGYTAEEVGVDKQFNRDWSDYKFGTYPNFTKYTGSDSLTILEPADDAATQLMGSDWRMPTREDFQELVSNTDIYFISTDGSEIQATYMGGTYNKFEFPEAETMKGMKLYNKGDHSKYIFVPASGVTDDGFVQAAGVVGYLWSSSLSMGNTRNAWYLGFHALYGYGYVYNYDRYCGFGVRGVKKGS